MLQQTTELLLYFSPVMNLADVTQPFFENKDHTQNYNSYYIIDQITIYTPLEYTSCLNDEGHQARSKMLPLPLL